MRAGADPQGVKLIGARAWPHGAREHHGVENLAPVRQLRRVALRLADQRRPEPSPASRKAPQIEEGIVMPGLAPEALQAVRGRWTQRNRAAGEPAEVVVGPADGALVRGETDVVDGVAERLPDKVAHCRPGGV